MQSKSIVGIDLAAKPRNPTGWACLERKVVETSVIYEDTDILRNVARIKPVLIAIDAPLSPPKVGAIRSADREMIKMGYPVFPPMMHGMRELTNRAISLNTLILENGYKTIEVHPTSALRALGIPKTIEKVQTCLRGMGLKGSLESRSLTQHELDAIIAVVTGYLYINGQTESIGDTEEGYVIMPKRQDWRKLKI